MATWPTASPTWNDECIKLLQDGSTTQLPDTNLKTIMTKSKNFPIKFPITTNTCQNLTSAVGKDILDRNIKSAYPVIHENILYLCAKFLLFKQVHGTDVEKNMYKNMTVKNLIDRLLRKRAVNFMEACDTYLLLDKSTGMGNWEFIGTRKEKAPLTLENCLSYDEIKLSAFLSVSSYNYFMSDGSRYFISLLFICYCMYARSVNYTVYRPWYVRPSWFLSIYRRFAGMRTLFPRRHWFYVNNKIDLSLFI